MMGMGMDPVAIPAVPFPVPALLCTNPVPVSTTCYIYA